MMTSGDLVFGINESGVLDVTLGASKYYMDPLEYRLDNGRFHHVGFTYNEGGSLRIFVDGVVILHFNETDADVTAAELELGNVRTHFSDINATTHPFEYAAFETWATSGGLTVYFDDVRYFTRALTGAEVRLQATMARGGVANVETGPTFNTRVSKRIVPCAAEISGSTAAEEGVAGLYVEVTPENRTGNVLVRSDNRTRLRWTAGPERDGAACKDGWIIESTTAEVLVEFHTCEDANSGAQHYLDEAYSEEFSDTSAVCGWAEGSGYCSDVVIASLCSFSCSPFIHAHVAGKEVRYQDTTLGLREVDCLGDNDFGLNAYLNSTGKACMDDSTMRNCLLSPIVAGLCKHACYNVAAQQDTTTTTTTADTDEMSLYGSRAQPFVRRLDHLGFRGAGVIEDVQLVKYTPYDGPDSDWTLKLRTWTGPDNDDECNTTMTDPNMPLLDGGDVFYWVSMPLEPTARMDHTCLLSLCPAGTVCVLDEERFENELQAQLEELGVADISTSFTFIADDVAALGVAPDGPIATGYMTGSKFQPKVLVGKDRTVAFLGPLFGGPTPGSGLDWFEDAGGAFRQVLGPLRVNSIRTIREGENVDADVVVTLLKNAEPAMEFFSSYVGDKVRLETFGLDGMPTNVDLHVELYVPMLDLDAEPLAFCFSPGGDRSEISVTKGGKVQGLKKQFFAELMVPAAALPCELRFTTDVKECTASAPDCHPNAKCMEKVGGLPSCVCVAPYVPTEGAGFGKFGCELSSGILPPEYYEDKYVEYEIRPLEHTVHGWRVKAVNSHKYYDCGIYSRQPFYDSFDIQSSKPLLGFPASNAFGGGSNEFRTECQACNALNTTLNEPDGMYVNDDVIWSSEPFIRFNLQYATLESLCISVEQIGTPVALQLYRAERQCDGPSEGAGSACQSASKSPSAGTGGMYARQTWSAEAAELAEFRIKCGNENQKLLGEAFLGAVGPVYMRGQILDVPSACHCEMLCIETATDGCVGWTYYEKEKHCSLLSTIFGEGEGWHGAAEIALADVRSGRLGYRIIDASVDITTTELTVQARGTGLDPELRLKLVPKGERCLAAPAKQVAADCASAPDVARTVRGENVSGTSYPFCALRPSLQREGNAIATATWTVPVQLGPAAELRACVCRRYNECANPTSWDALEVKISLPEAEVLWTASADFVVRDTNYSQEDFTLDVVGSHTDLYLVKATLGCDVVNDATARVTVESSAPPRTLYSVQLAWSDEDWQAHSSREQSLVVCVQTETDGEYLPISAANGAKTIKVVALESDVIVPFGPFTGHTASVSLGEKRTINIEGRMLSYELAADKLGLGQSCEAIEEEFIAKSSSSQTEMQFDVISQQPAGSYAMCYCDGSVLNATDMDSLTYAAERHTALSESLLSTAYLGADEIGVYAEDICHEKCSGGCTGCGCEGFNPSIHGPRSRVLCITAERCEATCTALGPSVCAGFEVRATSRGECRLRRRLNGTNVTQPEVVTSQYWHGFTRASVTCTYSLIGTMTVTDRMHVGVDYIVSPDTPSSIDVVRPSGAVSGLSVKDRILVAPCGSPCPPTEALEFMGGWWQLAARNAILVDPVTEDNENAVPSAAPFSPVGFVDVHKEPISYCPGNLDIETLDALAKAQVQAARCFTKCAAGCSGPECFCDGFMTGYDGEKSQAVCGDQALCEKLCADVGCASIDMHNTLPRCYLNSGMCDKNDLVIDNDYSYITEKLDACGEAVRKLEDRTTTAEEKCIAMVGCCFGAGRCAECAGNTTEGKVEVLEFGPVSFPAGTYQVCACDAELGTDLGSPCRHYSDFTIDLGTLHSSGVQCLLGDTKLARATCTEQSGGGLRCE
jgi:hypothetical protein